MRRKPKPEPIPTPKFVQIACSSGRLETKEEAPWPPELFALDEQGHVWLYVTDCHHWCKLRMVAQPG